MLPNSALAEWIAVSMIQECESLYSVKTMIDLEDVRMAKKREQVHVP